MKSDPKPTRLISIAYAQVILAAVLFGISTPAAKLLLRETQPIPLAALLYLGCGIGLGLFRLAGRLHPGAAQREAGLKRQDVPWLAGSIFSGGVAAPILLLVSLSHVPAASASLLLNFESVATTVIAFLLFREAVGRRVWQAVLLITSASILLTWDARGGWGVTWWAFGILAACTFWGLDNNFTRNVSSKDPLATVMYKGLGAGLSSLVIARLIGDPFPEPGRVLLVMLLGLFSYGVSIVLFIRGMRQLGAARTSALYGAAPFVGAGISFAFFPQNAAFTFWLSLPIMALGVFWLLRETHNHAHTHLAIEHEHQHSHDEHHQHQHPEGVVLANTIHSHWHVHAAQTHQHAHTPDIHHRHTHPDGE